MIDFLLYEFKIFLQFMEPFTIVIDIIKEDRS